MKWNKKAFQLKANYLLFQLNIYEQVCGVLRWTSLNMSGSGGPQVNKIKHCWILDMFRMKQT